MTHQGTAIWRGASCRTYTYWIYSLSAKLSSGQDGNYIYTKIVNQYWQPIYIGQGDLGDRTDVNTHHQSICLKSKGVTHVHAHVNSREADRLAEGRIFLQPIHKPINQLVAMKKLGGNFGNTESQ